MLLGCSWRFVQQGHEALIGHPPAAELALGAQLDAEIAVTALYRYLVHWLGEQQGKSVRAFFSYSAPSHVERYRAVFGTQLQFDCAMTGIAFPLAFLDQARPGADEELANAMSHMAERWLPAADAPTWTSRVRRAFASVESFASFRLESLASQWGMSLRSLRRRLEAENTTLTAVLEAELFARASELLSRRSHTPAQIAELLGYGEVNSFQRAFKRWSGVTPSEFRRRTPQLPKPDSSAPRHRLETALTAATLVGPLQLQTCRDDTLAAFGGGECPRRMEHVPSAYVIAMWAYFFDGGDS